VKNAGDVVFLLQQELKKEVSIQFDYRRALLEVDEVDQDLNKRLPKKNIWVADGNTVKRTILRYR